MAATGDMVDQEFIGVPNELELSDDEGTDGHKHAKLLQAMASLGGKKKPSIVQRTEPTVKASEFNLAPATGKVNIQELIGALKNTESHDGIKKQLGKIQEGQKLLDTPLPKNELAKIQRTVAYESASNELAKWDPIVTKNRKAEQMHFPLVKPNVNVMSTSQMTKNHKPRTPLEVEIAKLLAGSKSVPSQNKDLTPAEERALQAMSIEEAKERRAELQKYRALLTYKEAKARRQKKIKSKRFHRILRKERQKAEKKELDLLQEKDPEAYADMLMKLHKDRIQERMSLKHRGGSKFMQKQTIYGKYDDKGRQAVADMLEKHKELRQKIEDNDDGSSDNDDDDVTEEDGASHAQLAHRVTPSGEPVSEEKNPWMKNLEPNIGAKTYTRLPEIRNKEMEEEKKEESDEGEGESDDEKDTQAMEADLGIDDIFDAAARRVRKKAADDRSKKMEAQEKRKEFLKKRREKNRRPKLAKAKAKAKENDSSSDSSSDEESEEEEEVTEMEQGASSEGVNEQGAEIALSNSLTRKRTLEDFDGMSDDEADDAPKVATVNLPTGNQDVNAKGPAPQVDPKKFLTVTTSIKSSLAPDVVEGSGEVEEEEEDQQRLTIAQAFASDDVVEEFKVEKAARAEKEKAKNIDLTLPGWGNWGGTGIQVSGRKKRRFTIKAPPAPPRKDAGMKGVIIGETKDNSIAKHQVKDVPFPFTSVHQFESSVRAPIGKTWNPEKAYRNLIKPKIVTHMGAVIDPIDKAHVFRKGQNQVPEKQETDKPSSSKKKARKGRNQQKKKPK